MTSNDQYKEAFVWIWLPNETRPVIAGRLWENNGTILFHYGKRYLERLHDTAPAISIYAPELPLRAGELSPLNGLSIAGCIRDAAPDAWGRRIIINKKSGHQAATAELDELTYLLESGSDRIGALDFQRSPSEYIPRHAANISMDELIASAEKVERGVPLTPELDQALLHASSVGGARPKALIEEQSRKYIAKFSSTTDLYSVIKAEFIAMRLAKLAGLNVAPVKLTTAANKDVLLVERFDRLRVNDGWSRKAMVSALTLFKLDEMMARYASYETLAEIIRHRFTAPRQTLTELFSRLVFNILCGNTDDHARNHAAFWDGADLSLTPAYDICPQGHTGNEATQAMLISGSNKFSQLKTCLETAHNFLISKEEAHAIFAAQQSIIEQHWDSVCDQARLGEVDKRLLWKRQFLNPFSIITE